MSASLVGSEMCIRDRLLVCVRVLGDVAIEVRSLRRSTRTIPRLMGPVSYTHLTLPTICSV
eukprot:3519946-Alexandrium_andersonii.AAC.1